jgi:hypothetical protein
VIARRADRDTVGASVNPFALFESIGGALLVLLVIVVVGWFAIARIRSWMRENAESEAPFTLDDLRRLRREGQLTEEEYETARQAMIGEVRGKSSLDAAEVKRRVAAGQRATQSRTTPPTTPGTPLRLESEPPPEDGTQRPRSPKRPPQLG